MPIEILMPALSPTMTEGNLAKWHVKEGDKVASGKVIAEIETDKATMEVEAVDEGVVGKILIKAGTEGVKVNEPIALLLAEGEDKKALDSWKPKVVEKPKEEKAEGKSDAKQDSAPAPVAAGIAIQASKAPDGPIMPAKKGAASGGERAKASPLAKRMAGEKGVDISKVPGSGPHGRVVVQDIEEALLRGVAGGGKVSRHSIEFYKVPNSSIRKVIARRLTESKQHVPHFYLTVECEIDQLLEARKVLNNQAASGKGEPAYKLSVNDMVIKATACALRDKPECNVSWYDDAIVQYNNVDISIAVSTDNGLITPIIRNADQKTLPQVSTEMKKLATRARENALKPEEFQGGGFSISNLGMYGVQEFAAIINPPQGAILAVGAGEEKVVRRGADFVVVNVMKLTLSVDHRCIDGALGAEFLQILKRYVESPVLMFV